MLSSKLNHIIIQAGGKGTRLEGLTRNKPKCLVPYNNLPIIFHLFAKFKGAKFTIIADYKIEVLQKYLAIFAPKFCENGVDYRILQARDSGTIAGIAEALEFISENEPFMIIWCDLILSNEFKLPNMCESSEDLALVSSESLSQDSIDSSTSSTSSTIPPPICQSLKNSKSKLDSRNKPHTKSLPQGEGLESCSPSLAEGARGWVTPQNFIGISGDFECRWSYENGRFINAPSYKNGVAGLFIFANKKCLKNIPKSGALVEWLQTQNIDFIPLDLAHSKEIGTLLVYTETNPLSLTRPFNKIEFSDNVAIKTPLDSQGREIAKKEIAWYEFVQNLGFSQIPPIYSLNPLTMKKIKGKNIYEYECLLKSQKREILAKIIDSLKSLHNLTPKIPANPRDCVETYITKTYDRLALVDSLIPFARDEFIKINGRYYKNALFCKEQIAKLITAHFPREFALIHGDSTFSNILFDSFAMEVVLIDPRGYFGQSQIYGDADYDFAKLYYSICGDYDQFNRKKFTLSIGTNEVELAIKSSGWSDMSEEFFDLLPNVSKDKIKLLHALIWLSLTTYAWEDYDSICAAFYRGNMLMEGFL